MVEYRKLLAKYDDKKKFDGFAIAKLATPKNVIDGKQTDFERIFKSFLENHIASNERRRLATVADVDNAASLKASNFSDADEKAKFGLLEVYEKELEAIDADTLTDDDKRFFQSLVYAVCGCGFRRKFSECNDVADGIKDTFTAFISGKKYDLKPIKVLFETVANGRLKSTAAGKIFKNFKCRFTDEMAIHILATAEKGYKWSQKGINKMTLTAAAPSIVREILITALKYTFDFDVRANSGKTAPELV